MEQFGLLASLLSVKALKELGFFNKKNKSNNAIVSQSKKQNDQFLDWCAEAYEILEGQ